MHPYWLEEELVFLYQPMMYSRYFNISESDIISIPVHHFWEPDLAAHSIVDHVNQFLGKNIPKDRSQNLHDRWQEINLYPYVSY